MNNNFLITGIQRVTLVDKYEYPENTTRFRSNLAHNELIFHFSGFATVYFDGKVLQTPPNSIRFLPKIAASEYVVERQEWGECILAAFETDAPISDEAFVLNVTNSDVLGALFKKMFSVWVSRRDGYYFECMSLLYKIFSEIQKQNYIPQKQYNTLKPAIEHIEKHFLDGKISLQQLADLCSVSLSYFKKLFFKKFGMPPSKYIIQLKINYACDLLRTDIYSVTEISEMCGYADIYFFSHQFKKYVGVPPQDFANKFKSSK